MQPKATCVGPRGSNVTSNLDDFGEVLTVREVARVLRVDKDSAYQAIHRGQIPHVRIGRSLRVPKAGLLRFLDAQSAIGEKVATATTPAVKSGGGDARATA